MFPADAGVYNVQTQFGARGDGITDDTAAIQSAFQATQGRSEILYFPAGIYLVSKPVWFRGFMFMQGEGADKTIIKLKDNAPGYQDPNNPKWLMGTTQPARPDNRSGDNMAFSNYILNLTLDTGVGNPGAIAIQFISNNGGGLDDVTIRSGDGTGVMGLDLRTPWNGPCLFKNVRITGFNYGIVSWNVIFLSTFEYISLQNQRVAGWVNYDHPLVVRKLTSNQSGIPAVINTTRSGWNEGQFVILDSELNNSSGSVTSAIDNKGGQVFVRNVRTTGYQAAVRNQGTVIPGTTVGEYISGQVVTQFPSPLKSLNLPIKKTPALPWEPLENWVSVKQFADRVTADGDWAPAVQAAIDSGKSTVYFPYDQYTIRSTIIVRGNVKVIQGLGSGLYAEGNGFNGGPMLRVQTGTAPQVFIDRFSFEVREGTSPPTSVEDASANTLVVLHSRYMSYRNAAGAGDLFVEDMAGAPWTFNHPQNVWIRALNVEIDNRTKVVNNAANLWVMGWKSEGRATELDNGSQARTELLGGSFYPANNGDRDQYPVFINRGGRVSLTHTSYWGNNTYIVDTWNGQTKTLRNGSPRFMPLYVTNP